MPNDRDTKFLGFAKLLWPEISHNLRFFDFGFSAEQQASIDERIQEIIAQRTYDLAVHVQEHLLSELEHKDTPLFQPVAHYMHDIPDLTQWPESSTE